MIRPLRSPAEVYRGVSDPESIRLAEALGAWSRVCIRRYGWHHSARVDKSHPGRHAAFACGYVGTKQLERGLA